MTQWRQNSKFDVGLDSFARFLRPMALGVAWNGAIVMVFGRSWDAEATKTACFFLKHLTTGFGNWGHLSWKKHEDYKSKYWIVLIEWASCCLTFLFHQVGLNLMFSTKKNSTLAQWQPTSTRTRVGHQPSGRHGHPKLFGGKQSKGGSQKTALNIWNLKWHIESYNY